MRPGSGWLASFAAAMLIVTIWLATIIAREGSQFLAAVGMGVAATATVHFILAAVRAERREQVKR